VVFLETNDLFVYVGFGAPRLAPSLSVNMREGLYTMHTLCTLVIYGRLGVFLHFSLIFFLVTGNAVN
jgi:hypothetical protein